MVHSVNHAVRQAWSSPDPGRIFMQLTDLTRQAYYIPKLWQAHSQGAAFLLPNVRTSIAFNILSTTNGLTSNPTA